MLEKLLLNKDINTHITLKPGLPDVHAGVGPRGSWVPPRPKDPPSSSSLRTAEFSLKIICIYGSEFLPKWLFYFWSHGGSLHLCVPTQVFFFPKYSPAHPFPFIHPIPYFSRLQASEPWSMGWQR